MIKKGLNLRVSNMAKAALFCAVALLLLVSVESVKKCKVKNGCKASCGGTDLDITKVFSNGKHTFLQSNNKYTYEFNCNGVNCSSLVKSAICQKAADGREWSAGLVTDVTFYLNSSSTYTVIYRNGNESNHIKRLSFMTFSTNKKSNISFLVEDENTNAYFFIVQQENVGISGDISGPIGWALIGIAVLAFLLYFIIGAVIMKFVRGASGMEIIPNYLIWKNFPFLVKDGFLFVLSPLLKRGGYEKL